jgi:hypothetical protein
VRCAAVTAGIAGFLRVSVSLWLSSLRDRAYNHAMRVVNRTAVTITGGQPYLDWMRQTDSDFNRTGVTVVVPRAKAYGSAFLLPEFDLEEDLQEWVEENAPWLFEFQLSAWTEDEAAWPATRDLKTFKEWFRIDIHSVVVDVGDDDIEGEEL